MEVCRTSRLLGSFGLWLIGLTLPCYHVVLGICRKNKTSLEFPVGLMVVGSEFKFSVEGIQKFQQVLRTRSLVIVDGN